MPIWIRPAIPIRRYAPARPEITRKSEICCRRRWGWIMATIIQSRARPHPVFTETESRNDLGHTQKRRVAWATWSVLAASLIAFNIFAYQVTLVPQTHDY